MASRAALWGGAALAGLLLAASKASAAESKTQAPVPPAPGKRPAVPETNDHKTQDAGHAPSSSAEPWIPPRVTKLLGSGPASLSRLKDLTEVKRSALVDFGAHYPTASSRSSSIKLVESAAAALAELVSAARLDGIAAPLLEPISGFRSPARQLELWNQAKAKYGSDAAARKWVAPPGHSTHQTGRAVDLELGQKLASQAADRSRATAAWKWMNTNAARFGFAPYEPEPWHWEYVGA